MSLRHHEHHSLVSLPQHGRRFPGLSSSAYKVSNKDTLTALTARRSGKFRLWIPSRLRRGEPLVDTLKPGAGVQLSQVGVKASGRLAGQPLLFGAVASRPPLVEGRLAGQPLLLADPSVANFASRLEGFFR